MYILSTSRLGQTTHAMTGFCSLGQCDRIGTLTYCRDPRLGGWVADGVAQLGVGGQ